MHAKRLRAAGEKFDPRSILVRSTFRDRVSPLVSPDQPTQRFLLPPRFLLFLFISFAPSSNHLPRLEDIDHVNVVVLVLHLDMLPYVRLHLAHVLAIRTLESRFLTALISQMTVQVLLPREHASTVEIRTGILARFHEPIGPSMSHRPRHHRAFLLP